MGTNESGFSNTAGMGLGNPMGAFGLGLMGAPWTGSGLVKMGAGSTTTELACTEWLGAGSGLMRAGLCKVGAGSVGTGLFATSLGSGLTRVGAAGV